jgi:hypothetical protein
MTKTQLRNLAITVGLTLYTWSPGDGVTRYRFFTNHHVSDYFEGEARFTALGLREAEAFVRGFQVGKGGVS